MTIKSVPKERFPELVQYIYNQCQTPEYQCLHAWANDKPEALLSDFQKYHSDGELLYQAAYLDSKIIAACGCEFDEELGRGWLHGPLLGSQKDAGSANQLYSILIKKLPPKIRILDAFPNIKNKFLRDFYSNLGFDERENFTHLYQLARTDFETVADNGLCKTFVSEQSKAFTKLYQAQFPNAYYSAKRVLEMNGTSHRIFTIGETDQVAGYVVVNRSEDNTCGEVDFLGVDPSVQGKGYGSALLSTGVEWIYNKPETNLITLSVFDNLTGARALYERQGFRLQYSGVGLRKILAAG